MSTAEPLILTYHSLDTSGSVVSIDPALFRRQISALQSAGFPVVPLGQAPERPGSVAITFDDGYENLFLHAAPLLAEAGMPATIFFVTKSKRSWAGAANAPLMNWNQVEEARRLGMEIGAHTASHADLTTISEADAASEIDVSRAEIERHTGVAPRSFAYPYGAINARVRAMVARRFDVACGAQLGTVAPGSDRFALPRVDMYYFRDLRRFQELIEGRARGYLRLRALLRRLRGSY